MRFLFVYQDFVVQARSLVEELLVTDVEVVVVRRGQLEPTPDEVRMFEEHANVEAAACQVDRKYRKNASRYVRFTIAPKKFRIGDQQLREWLAPSGEPDEAFECPTGSFTRAARSAEWLLLHPDALRRADELHQSRWAFAGRSAELLARLADEEDLGPMREWADRHGVAFASHGQVEYQYSAYDISGTTAWHLKSGDHTTPDRAARVYFKLEKPYVLVFYVGPHPHDGTYSAAFT